MTAFRYGGNRACRRGKRSPLGALALVCASVLALALVGCSDNEGTAVNPEAVQHEVRFRDGKVAAVFLRRVRDGKLVYKGFPRGLGFASQAGPPTLVGHDELHDILERDGASQTAAAQGGSTTAPAPRVARAAVDSSTYVQGFPAGYLPSIGAVQGDCFNYTLSPPNSFTAFNSSLTINSSSMSQSSSFNATASISGVYEGYSGSDDFTYSDTYNSTQNSAAFLTASYIVYALEPGLDTSNALNAEGNSEQEAGTFGQICGTDFIQQVAAGMLIQAEITVSSDTATAVTAFSNKMSGSEAGVASLNDAVSEANSVSGASNTFTLTMSSIGGGTMATGAISDAVCEAQTEGIVTQCWDETAAQASMPNPPCATYASLLQSAATTAINEVEGMVSQTPFPTNLDFLAGFPNGLQVTLPSGQSVAPLIAVPLSNLVPDLDFSDPYEPYETQLVTYVNLMNQISTLNQRALAIQSLFTLYPTLPDPPQIDLMSQYLETIQGIYGNDIATMVANLRTCLTIPGSVEDVCAPIINNVLPDTTTLISDAYQWYSSTQNPNPNFQVQQNTIGLQYTVNNFSNRACDGHACGDENNPMDAMYVQSLPNFENTIGNNPALVAFADQPYTGTNGKGHPLPGQTGPWIIFIPIASSTDTMTDIYAATDPAQFWGIINENWYCENCYPNTHWSSTTNPACAPTVDESCSFSYQSNFDSSGRGELSLQFNLIPNFFGQGVALP